jgi:hypothetical protein
MNKIKINKNKSTVFYWEKNSRNLSYTSILLYDIVKPTHRWLRGAKFLQIVTLEVFE